MAKVVLVWNEHPTEVVAGFHARKVAEILRRKYKHRVIIEKVSPRETNYGILKTVEQPPRQIARALAELKTSAEIAKKFEAKHKAPAFNFHASGPHQMGNAREKSPNEFQLGEVDPENHYFTGFPFELALAPYGRSYVLEMPGALDDLNSKKKALAKKAIRKVRRSSKPSTLFVTGPFGYRLGVYERVLMHTRNSYHLQRMPLAAPEQQKYLHPAISEKIAAAIHERITRKI